MDLRFAGSSSDSKRSALIGGSACPQDDAAPPKAQDKKIGSKAAFICQRVGDNAFHLCSFPQIPFISCMAIASINPATGEKLKEFAPFDNSEIEERLSRAEQAFRKYRRTTFTERAEFLEAVAELLFQEKNKFALIITLEMGKLFRDSLAEIEKCARGFRFYAENGE